MTNAEKYFKNDVNKEEISKGFLDYLVSDGVYRCNATNIVKLLEDFLNKETKLTLTDDERVILRNIDKTYTHISRTYGNIWVGIGEETADSECKKVCVFNHLFQFIEERRRV